METHYCTFQYYDYKGRRLAVFCRFLNSTEAELFTLTCSKEEQFNKKYARQVYQDFLDGKDPLFEKHKPVIDLVVIEPEQREMQVLIEFCRRNYYFYVPIIDVNEVLVNVEQLASLDVFGNDLII